MEKNKIIPHSRPTLDDEDRLAVLNVMRTEQIVQGEQVAGFEADMSDLIGVPHAVALSSGTAALHLALIALGIGDGDEVICPSYVCTALLHAVRMADARPVIADVERDTFNIDAKDVRMRMTSRTKAVIVPHLFGLPADMTEITALGVPVIEDCAQALGSRFQGRYTGGFGAISIFSFYATKVIATGEGGMALSSDATLAEKIRDMRDYDEKDQDAPRYNYKMTDMQAALGRSQLGKIGRFIERRKEIARHYDLIVKKADMDVPFRPPGREHIYYRYVVTSSEAKRFIGAMRQSGIACRRPVFRPLNRYLNLSGYGVTDSVWDRAVSIPIYPSLTESEIARISDGVRKAGLLGGRFRC